MENKTGTDVTIAGSENLIDAFRGDHAFLSNFYQHPVEIDGIVYPTAEHAFQALKTLDAAEREKVRAARTPTIAKRLGKKVTLRPDWNTYRFEAMRRVLRAKFSDPELAARLAQTGQTYLVEGNTWGDTTWGAVRREGEGWKGENRLGRLLMQVREEVSGYAYRTETPEPPEDTASPD